MIRTLIIDDEAKARQGLSLVLEKHCPEIDILALCPTPEQGLEKIASLQPDLVFLDVQMPHITGFELLELVPRINFEVIFVTAYDKYAMKAIKFSALDYLLKPVDLDELTQAIERLSQRQQRPPSVYQSLLNNVQSPSEPLTRLAIPSENEILMQPIEEIIYGEAASSYTILHLVNQKKLTVSKTLKDFENILPEDQFCRIHHSTLVNMKHIEKYVRGEGGYVVVTGGTPLNVSRRKKEQFLQMLTQW